MTTKSKLKLKAIQKESEEDYLKKIAENYLFHAGETPDGLCVAIVSKDYWRKNRHLADESPEEIVTILDSLGIFEVMESMYESENDLAGTVKALRDAGFQTDAEFDEFMGEREGLG
jgi:hypothetical protein